MKVLKNISLWGGSLMAMVFMLFMTACPEDGTPDLSDAEIASVAVTANQIDVRYGELAVKKSDNPQVVKFAKTMIRDHNNIIKQAADLAKKLGVTPKDNAVSQSLLDGEKKTMANLKGLDGLAFDKAYIKNEVEYHKAVISAVKNVLIPQTDNAELKDLIVKVVPLLEHHLHMAEMANKKIAAIPELSDAEIASVAVVANQIDVRYGKIAMDKSDNAEVVKFAETMIRDHNNIIKQAAALAKKLGVTPKDNAVSQSLLDGEKKTTAKLNSLSGDAFDEAYINNEVAYHKAVISAVKNVLVPQTDNAQLKGLIVKVIPLLEHHLHMAEMAQKKIVGK